MSKIEAASSKSLHLSGNVAVVTGGTQGLGEATARLLGACGAAGIIICGRNVAAGAAVAQSISDTETRAVFVEADLTREEDCAKVIRLADDTFGRIDILANCAGITHRGTIWNTDTALWDHTFAINVRAPFLLMQGAIRIMKRQGISGAIVNVASIAAHGGTPDLLAYSAAKAALVGATKNVAFCVMRDRIRVNALAIGWMDTPAEDQIQRAHYKAPEEWLRQAENCMPFGRLLKTEEVARWIVHLASPAAGIMTGSVIDLDQGVIGAYEATPQPVTSYAP